MISNISRPIRSIFKSCSYKISTVLLMILFIPGISSAETTPDWSLRFLARTSNFLLVANDSLLAGEKAFCKIEKDQVQPMILNLKKQIDQKLEQLTPLQKKKIRSQTLTCEQECTCDIYALLFEKESDTPSKKLLGEIQKTTSLITSDQRKSCAEKFQSICHTRLFHVLREP
jgi:hypothetical protein